MRGQIKLEFIFSIVVFAVVVFAIAAQLNTSFIIAASDSEHDMLRGRAAAIAALLAQDQRLGLSAGMPWSLSRAKIGVFDCNTLEQQLGTSTYQLIIRNATDELLRCGAIAPAIAIGINRPVWLETELGELILKVW